MCLRCSTIHGNDQKLFRNDETIISSISVTDIVFDVYLGKWNYRAIPKVKTWSYFLTIPKYINKLRFLNLEEYRRLFCIRPLI